MTPQEKRQKEIEELVEERENIAKSFIVPTNRRFGVNAHEDLDALEDPGTLNICLGCE